MKFSGITVLFFALSSVLLAVPNVNAELIPSADGLTVYDTVAEGEMVGECQSAGNTRERGRFGVANINPNGSMDYATALQWVDALNSLNGGVGYLGHNNWTLPTTPDFSYDRSLVQRHQPSGRGIIWVRLHEQRYGFVILCFVRSAISQYGGSDPG